MRLINWLTDLRRVLFHKRQGRCWHGHARQVASAHTPQQRAVGEVSEPLEDRCLLSGFTVNLPSLEIDVEAGETVSIRVDSTGTYFLTTTSTWSGIDQEAKFIGNGIGTLGDGNWAGRDWPDRRDRLR